MFNLQWRGQDALKFGVWHLISRTGFLVLNTFSSVFSFENYAEDLTPFQRVRQAKRVVRQKQTKLFFEVLKKNLKFNAYCLQYPRLKMFHMKH